MKVAFAYPSTGQATGGEVVLYEFAAALSRRGIPVEFIHGPAAEQVVRAVDELPAVARQADVRHHFPADLHDASLPETDVIFTHIGPPRLGLPVTVIQGYRMLSEEWEAAAFRVPGLKVCVASWLCEVGETYGVPAERFVHVPPGIDHAVFRARPLEGRSLDVSILHHPFREKGWPTGKATLEILAERRPDISCAVFSRRDPRPLPPGVRFIDSPDHAELSEHVYGQTRVFVQSSRNEGFGLTALEAMACGAALVTTDCGGSRDYGLPGRTADVVPVEDPEALAAAVIALLDDEPRRLSYAVAGAEHARTFDWDTSAAKLEAALLAYLDDPAPHLEEPGPDRPEERQPRPNAAGSAT